MPTIRYEIRSEYGLADPELLRAADKDDPEAVLEGVAMSGLVGVLRQLGDLAEFATEIFHELHEEVMCTAARGHGLKLRVQQLESEFPPVEKAFFSHPTHSSFTYNEGTDWHANIRIDQNLITQGDMPRFILDSYEECRGPPRLFMLDKFDIAGAGACLKRYSDPSFFKTELTSRGMIDVDIRREKKPRKVKKKTSRGKLGQTLESLLSPNAESSSGLLVPSEVLGKPVKRLVRLKSRHLNRGKEIKLMDHLLELHSDVQKVVLDSSQRQSNGKVQLKNVNELTSKLHDAVKDKSISHPLTNDENIITSIEGDTRLTQTCNLDHQKIEDDLREEPHECYEVEDTSNNNHLAVQNEIWADLNVDDHALDDAETIAIPKDKNTITSLEVTKLMSTYELEYQMIEDELPDISHETAWKVKEVKNNKHPGENKIESDSMTKSGDSSNENKLDQSGDGFIENKLDESGDSSNENKLDDAGTIPFPRGENTDKVIRSTPINELQYELTEALDKATCEVEEADKSIHHQELNQMMADSKTMSGDSVSDYQLSDAEKTTLLKEGDTTTSMDESIRSMPMNKTEYQKIENPLLEEPNKEETFNRIHLIEHKELITDSETRKGDGISTYEFGDSEFSMLSQEAEKTLNDGELKLQCTGDDDRSQGTGSDLGNFMESLNSMESEVEVNSEKKNKPLSVDAMYLDSDEHQVQNSELVSTENTIAFMESEVELNSEKKDKPLILDAMYLYSDEATDEHRVQKYELVSAENTIAFKESEVEVHSEKKDKPLSVHAMYLDSGEVTDEHRVQNSELVPVEKTTAFDLNDILDDKISCLLMSDSSYTMSETQIIQEVSITSNLERSFEMHLGETQDNMTEELEVVVTVSSSASKTCDIEIFNGPGLRSDHMEASSYGSNVIESTCDLNISQECHDDLQTHTAMQNDISTSSDGISDRTAVGKNFDGLPHLNIDIPGDFHPIEHMDGLVSEDKSGSDELFVCVSPTTNHNSISVISLTEDSLVTTPGIREMQELDDMSEEASLGENTHSSPDNVSVTAVHPHVLAAETPNNLPIKCLSEEILSNGVEKSDLANNIQGLSIGEEVHHDHENSYSDNHSLGITTHDMAVVSDSDGHLVDMTDQHNEFHVGYTPDSLCPLTLQSEVTEELLVEDKKRCSSEIPDLNFSLTTEINDDLANTSANSVSSVEIEGLHEISNSQIKMSAQQSEQNHFFDPEEHQTIEADSEGEKGALIDHVQPHLCPNDPEIIESMVVNLRSADERYSSEEKKTIKENANSEYSHEKVAVKDEDANHDISSLSSPEASCSQELLNDNSMHDTAISYPYDVTQVPEKCNQNNNVCLISQSILEMTVESLEQPELDDTVPDPHLQLLEEVSSDKSDSLVHALSKDQPKSQSSVDDSEWSLDRKQGEIQKSPEQSHHDNANEEMFVYTNVSSKSETLPEEEIKLQVSKEENLTYLRKSDEYFELDTLSVSSDIVTIPVEEADKRPATSGEHIIFHTAIEDNTTTSSQLDEYLEVYTNTNPSGFNDNTLIEGSEANVITFDNNDEHIDLNKSSSNIDTMRQIESGLFPSSGIVSALSASTIESNVTTRHLSWIPGFNMTSNKGSSQVSYSDVLYQSSCAASQDIEEAPPLPPLPPLEWRSVKLRDNSLSSFGISFQNLSETSSLVAPPPAQCNSKHASLPEGDKMILSPYSLANIPTFETKSFQESSLDTCGKWGMPQELSQCPPIVHDQHDGSCQQQLEEEFMDLSRISLQYETSSYGPGESKEPKLEPSFSPFTLEDKTSQHLPDVEFELLNDSQNINLDLDEHQNLSLVGSAINYDEGHSGNRTLKSDNDHFSSLEPSRSTVLEISHPGYAALLEENQSPYFGLLWRLEDETPNVRPCSVRNRPRDPLIEAVAAHDRSTLRKVSDLVRPSDGHKEDERNSMLEQIRNKAFSLRPAVVTKHNTKGPSTNLKVAAIIEKANAIRQACAGSDEDDDADSWSDS